MAAILAEFGSLPPPLLLFHTEIRKAALTKGTKEWDRLDILNRELHEEACFDMTENQIATEIVDAAFKIHSTMGPGLFESVYETLLEFELRKRGLVVRRQWPIPVIYEEVRLEDGFRCDLLVQNLVIVEKKSVEELAPVHFSQLLTYLRFADRRLGILINFNVHWIKDGIRRIANGTPR